MLTTRNSVQLGTSSLVPVLGLWILMLLQLGYSQAPNGASSGTKVTGKINGKPVTLTEAVYREGWLQIHVNDATIFPPPGIDILLNEKKGEIPGSKSFSRKIDETTPNRTVGTITLRWPQTESQGENSKTRYNKFDLNVEFGTITGDQLPGKISLRSPEDDTELNGEFLAHIKGLRLKEGNPDLHSDAGETLEYAAKIYLSKKWAKPIQVVERHNTLLLSNPTKQSRQLGALTLLFRVGEDTADHWTRLVFEKKEEWAVLEEMKMDQFILTHPVFAEFPPAARMGKLYELLQKELQKAYPGKMLFDPDSGGGVMVANMEKNLAAWTPVYQVEGIKDDHPQNHAKLDALSDLKILKETWRLKVEGKHIEFVRKLDENEEFDQATGEIKTKQK
ncbi:hypothetical protein HYR69_09555 [Candidatus Sumerlaeota bacterium]|nr:hypothetical protein [Candidatus Sumerlaeota bacterium]